MYLEKTLSNLKIHVNIKSVFDGGGGGGDGDGDGDVYFMFVHKNLIMIFMKWSFQRLALKLQWIGILVALLCPRYMLV